MLKTEEKYKASFFTTMLLTSCTKTVLVITSGLLQLPGDPIGPATPGGGAVSSSTGATTSSVSNALNGTALDY